MDKGSKSVFRILFYYLRNDKFKVFLYILFSVLSYVPSILCALLSGLGVEALVNKDFPSFAKYLLYSILLYIFISCIAKALKEYIYNKLQIKFIQNVSKDLYQKYQDLPAYAFENMGTGELINRISSDPERVLSLLARLVRLISKAIVVLVVVVISFKVSIFIGFEIMLFAFIMGGISFKFFPIIKDTQVKIKKYSDKVVKNATENITGIREIKALGIKENTKKIMDADIENLCEQNLKITNYEIAYNTLNSMTYFALQFLMLLTCGYLFSQGYIVYSIFTMISNYIHRIDDVVSSLSEFGVDYNKVKVSLGRIDEIINNRLYEDEKYGNVTIEKPKGIINFNNVTFKYPEDEVNTLNNLSLEFVPKRKIAIVGRSGNGKTTIFNLLLRFFDDYEGNILIDGIDIKDLTEESLRSTISIIRQNPHLFNMSVMDNFRLAKPDVTLEEVRKVCKQAYIDDYIMSLPHEYDSIIGEGGINLSGGQKQRIAIARTLLLNTKVILFDEATSSLDNESQKYIKKTIDSLKKRHTVIIVAHRLSTIIDADEIYLIDKGRLASKGTHQELLRKSKIYKALYLNEDLKGGE